MSRIVGLVCDGCGKLDVEISEPVIDMHRYNEDNFPRNGWMSVAQWRAVESSREYAQVEEPEIHICSSQCLLSFASKFQSAHEDLQADVDGGHEH